VVVLSNDTLENHKVYLEDVKHLAGGHELNVPMIADQNGEVSRILGLTKKDKKKDKQSKQTKD
jgi:alkyl hydroperoxide reductase subunit AhpC